MKVSFNGFGENVATFEAASSITDGAPVMITDNGKVSAASGAFCGICRGCRAGYAAVQLSGYCRFEYTTAPDAVGYNKLSAASGKVSKDTANGREYLVVDIDTTDHTIGIML